MMIDGVDDHELPYRFTNIKQAFPESTGKEKTNGGRSKFPGPLVALEKRKERGEE